MSTQFDMSWNNVSSGRSEGDNNVTFLKLKTGDNRVRIVSSPSKIEQHWEETLDGGKRKVICLGPKCPICKHGGKAQVRYQFLVLDREDNEVKVLECGNTIVNAIKSYAIDPDYGDPTKYDIKIKKEGSGLETKYSVIGTPNKTELTDEEKAKISAHPTIQDINKIRTEDEVYGLQLKILADEMIGDTVGDDDFDMESGDGDDDWDNL